jgi:hypothetical protein
MKINTLKLATLALVPAALLAFSSCSTTDGTEEMAAVETPDGAIIVDKYTMTATVTGIDAANRKVTLVAPNGAKTTYKVGPAAINFGQIQVGDQVNATVTEEAAVLLRQPGTAASVGAGAAVALAPVGAKPGGMLVDTHEVTATISAIDAKHHKVTFQLADGTTRKVKVGKQINLAQVQVGDAVTVQLSEGLAITVTKP